MTAEERLENAGYEGVMIFKDFSYDNALIGVSEGNRAIYDYEKMVDWLVEEHNFTYTEAMEWIDFNTLRALPYYGDDAPIVMYKVDHE